MSSSYTQGVETTTSLIATTNVNKLATTPTVKAFNEFTLFPKLPTEIRLAIWAKSLPGPRKIILHTPQTLELSRKLGYKHFRQFKGNQMLATTKFLVPAMLHVNQESCLVAQKIYKPGFVKESYQPMYFDESRDVVMSASKQALKIFQKMAKGKGASTAVQNWAIEIIRHRNPTNWNSIGVQDSIRVKTSIALSNFIRLFLCSGLNLQTMTFVHQEWDKEFAVLDKYVFWGELETRDLIRPWYEYYHGRVWSVDEMPAIRHMTVENFEAQYE